jgi:hypothetical protein
MGGGRAIETGRIIDARTRKGRLARNTVLFNLLTPELLSEHEITSSYQIRT